MNPTFRKVALVAAVLGFVVSVFVAACGDDDDAAPATHGDHRDRGAAGDDRRAGDHRIDRGDDRRSRPGQRVHASRSSAAARKAASSGRRSSRATA